MGSKEGFVGWVTSGNAQTKSEGPFRDSLADTAEADETELFISEFDSWKFVPSV